VPGKIFGGVLACDIGAYELLNLPPAGQGVPTLSPWAMVAMILLLAAVGARRMARRANG